MNLSLTLLKIIPLITLLTGLLLPAKMTKAASSEPTEKASGKQEIVNGKEKGKEETGEHHTAAVIPQILLSKKAQQIEFFVFLSLIGCSIVAPELFYKPKKNSQSLKSSETEEKQQAKISEIEPELTSLKVIPENNKRLNLVSDNSEEFKNQEKIELESQSEQERKAA
jgi:hypothetical protein